HQRQIAGALIDRAANLLSRFEFKSCIFHSVIVDDHFLAWFKLITSAHSFTSFELINSEFEDTQDNEGRTNPFFSHQS
ncbi:hypothetical protein PENTCL1PPCAC_24105, partial [Pristionchus entomophagus]